MKFSGNKFYVRYDNTAHNYWEKLEFNTLQYDLSEKELESIQHLFFNF